jgi:hypothetical protein
VSVQASGAPGRADTPILLLTKLHPPLVPAQTIARERLLERLREGTRTLDDGPLPDGLASIESSLSVLSATFAWGDVGAVLEHGTRSAALEARSRRGIPC